MAKKSKKREVDYNSIPSEIELFGRIIKTYDDSYNLNINRNFGEARYGVNQIAITSNMGGNTIPPDELKVTYLHELMHFILYFTGFEQQLSEKGIDLEQFVDLVANAFYQYEKSKKFE